MRAIILAGGKGTRLHPFTTLIPKPLVPIGNEMSILEIIIQQLARHGFDHITITVNHLANLISAFVGDGSKFGIKIDFSVEESPLSTIGPITLIDDLPEDFLVMNGDILCDLNYKEFYDHHVHMKRKMTVSTFKRKTMIDFGVIQYDGDHVIRSFTEKPVYEFDVSMGIYCINRSVIRNLKRNARYGFDDLMLDGLLSHQDYTARPFDGFWLDLGRPEDYDYCNENYVEIKGKLGIK